VPGPVHPALYARRQQHDRLSEVRAVSFMFFAKIVKKKSFKKQKNCKNKQKKNRKKIGAPTE
jgi:hypothetical protein